MRPNLVPALRLFPAEGFWGARDHGVSEESFSRSVSPWCPQPVKRSVRAQYDQICCRRITGQIIKKKKNVLKKSKNKAVSGKRSLKR